jgi:hypothetical protein
MVKMVLMVVEMETVLMVVEMETVLMVVVAEYGLNSYIGIKWMIVQCTLYSTYS